MHNIHRRDGFLADPSLRPHTNLINYLKQLPTEQVIKPVNNLTLHNLCKTTTKLPFGTKRVLGRGLNFGIITPYPTNNIEEIIGDFHWDIRNRNYWRNLHEEDPTNPRPPYIPKLYIKRSRDERYNPPPASENVETSFKRFSRRLRKEHAKYARIWSRPNLSKQEFIVLYSLKNNPNLIVIFADKNLGPVIIERSVYIQWCLKSFLGKENQYQYLNRSAFQAELNKMAYTVDRFKNSAAIPEHIRSYIRQCFDDAGTRQGRFRATAKVHKQPHALRPVNAKCGTGPESISKWLDYELQKLVQFIPSNIKDSKEYHARLTSKQWPAGTKIITADATAMYDNITINQGIEIIGKWLNHLNDNNQLPDDFPAINIILEALSFIMKNNITQFGDCFFKQLCGTAMGTSVAVMYAGFYYGWHEKVRLLPGYSEEIQDLARFVDDLSVLWLGSLTRFHNFKDDINDFGILRWKVEEPSAEGIFLDLIISISPDGIVSTKTYQKPMNLYLYLLPSSAHQKNTMKGVIFGELKRYYWQCTDKKDYVEVAKLFFRRLLDRGWDFETLKQMFSEANRKVCTPPPPPQAIQEPTTSVNNDTIYLKLGRFHPQYIPSRTCQQIFEEELSTILRDEIGINKMIVCYKRAKNIGDIVSQTSLFQNRGEEVSTYLGKSTD